MQSQKGDKRTPDPVPEGWWVRRPETVGGMYSVIRTVAGCEVSVLVTHEEVTGVLVSEPLRPEQGGVQTTHVLHGPFATIADAARAGTAKAQAVMDAAKIASLIRVGLQALLSGTPPPHYTQPLLLEQGLARVEGAYLERVWALSDKGREQAREMDLT